MSAHRANHGSFLFKDLYNEIMRPKDRRDFPGDEMPLGEKAQDEDLKGMEEGGICHLPEISHLAHVLCLCDLAH